MRVLCVGRHAFLSEHLCRVFGAVGAVCEPVIGTNAVSKAALRFEPQVIVCEGDLLTTAVLESWTRAAELANVPVLAVSLSPRPDDVVPTDLSAIDPAAVIYLPSLDRAQVAALLDSAGRPHGVSAPHAWRLQDDSASAHQR
jgi:hypothetical protein